MRKKFFLLALITMLLPLLANAQTFENGTSIDGINYKLDTKTKNASVCSQYITGLDDGQSSYHHSDYSGNLIIPSEVLYKGNKYTVTSFEDRAFHNCEKLTSITIPKSIISIKMTGLQSSIFWGCNNLKSIIIDNENKKFDSRNNCNAIIVTESNELIAGCQGTTIPDGIKSIGDFAFERCSCPTSITIPNSVTSIGNYTFKDCSGLTSVTIGDGVTSIGYRTFYNCSALTSVTIGNGVTSIGIQAFWACGSLTDVYLMGENAPEVSKVSFSEVNIKNATLHAKDKIIESLKIVEPWKWFKNFVCDEKVTDFKLTYYVDGEVYKTMTHKYGDKINQEANPVKGDSIFSGWSYIPETMPGKDVNVYGSFRKGVYKITYKVDGEVYASFDVKCYETITVETEPTKKGMTFSGWSYIPETMPEKDIEVVGTFSWSKVTEDGMVYQVTDTINNVCTVINTEIESGAVKIASSVIFDEDYKVRTIADKVFYGKSGITSIELPSTITIIGERVFANIDKLTDVTVLAGEIPNTDRTAFENSYIEDYVTLHVPGSAISKYKATAPWKNFKEIVAIEGTEVVPQIYTIIYVVDGEIYKTVDVSKGESVDPEAEPTKEGYTFSGWSEIPGTMPGEDVVVTGHFTINSYMLTYYLDGEVYKTYSVEYGSSISSENAPDKEGYTFGGWGDVPQTMPAGDVTLYGTYTVNTYKLIFMVDGEVYKIVEVKYGDKLPTEEEPTKDGYVFSGWSWMPSKMPAEDVTVSGTFKQIGYNIDDNIYMVDGNEVTLAKSNVAGGDIIISPTVIINNNVYNVTTIGQYAFANNNGIKSVTIPDGVTTIGDNAFEGCSGIRKITLGKDVGFIGRRTFADIFKSGARTRSEEASLTVECHADKVPGAYYDSFEGTDISSAVLKVNDDLVSTFKATSPWNGFGAVIGFNEAEALGIGTVMTAEKETEIFSIDGRRLNKTLKGLNIIRTSKGVKKLYSK